MPFILLNSTCIYGYYPGDNALLEVSLHWANLNSKATFKDRSTHSDFPWFTQHILRRSDGQMATAFSRKKKIKWEKKSKIDDSATEHRRVQVLSIFQVISIPLVSSFLSSFNIPDLLCRQPDTKEKSRKDVLSLICVSGKILVSIYHGIYYTNKCHKATKKRGTMMPMPSIWKRAVCAGDIWKFSLL